MSGSIFKDKEKKQNYPNNERIVGGISKYVNQHWCYQIIESDLIEYSASKAASSSAEENENTGYDNGIMNHVKSFNFDNKKKFKEEEDENDLKLINIEGKVLKEASTMHSHLEVSNLLYFCQEEMEINAFMTVYTPSKVTHNTVQIKMVVGNTHYHHMWVTRIK